MAWNRNLKHHFAVRAGRGVAEDPQLFPMVILPQLQPFNARELQKKDCSVNEGQKMLVGNATNMTES